MENKAKKTLNDFIVSKPRMLPVLIAIDRSGSMEDDGKIEALNLALKDFVSSMQGLDSNRHEIYVGILSFGDNSATYDVPLSQVDSIEVPEYKASGRTPMGSAINMMKDIIEDKNAIPSTAYRPTVVILTDGMPTDGDICARALVNFVNEGRSSKAFRIAMAIGDDADKRFLKNIVSDPSYLVVGENARDIRKFFRFVTMSVSQRAVSATPNNIQAPVMPDDEIEF